MPPEHPTPSALRMQNLRRAPRSRAWSLGHRSLRGGALIRLAEPRARQGRFEEAEQLLDGFDVEAEAAWPLATVYLAKGERSRARDTLERALSQVDPEGGSAAPLLALLVDVHLAARSLDDADAMVEQLARCATAHGSHYLKATAALARGRVGLALGRGDPQADFREAVAGFARAEMPMEIGAREGASHRAPRGGDGRGAGRARHVRAARGRARRRRGGGRPEVSRRPGDHKASERSACGAEVSSRVTASRIRAGPSARPSRSRPTGRCARRSKRSAMTSTSSSRSSDHGT